MRHDAGEGVLHNAKLELADLPNENFVAAWREKRGMTQAQLAEAIGTTSPVISLLESGKRQLSPKWLRKIGHVLNVPIGYLLEHHPDDLPDDVLEIWARVPEEKREDARAMLRIFARTGTEG